MLSEIGFGSVPFAALRVLREGQRFPSADASGQANPLALKQSGTPEAERKGLTEKLL